MDWIDYKDDISKFYRGPLDYFNFNYKTSQFAFNFIGRISKHILQNLFYKVKVDGIENVPRERNFVLMPNHISHADSYFAMINLYPCKAANAIADEKLFRSPFFRKAATLFNAFPVRKGTKNLEIVNYAAKRVNNGDSLLWYPEGQRHKNPSENKCNPGKLGSGMLAHSVDAPIVPCFIAGTEFVMPVGKGVQIGKIPRSINILLRYGKPIYLDDLRELPSCQETSQKIVDRIMIAIEKLRPKNEYIDQSHKL